MPRDGATSGTPPSRPLQAEPLNLQLPCCRGRERGRLCAWADTWLALGLSRHFLQRLCGFCRHHAGGLGRTCWGDNTVPAKPLGCSDICQPLWLHGITSWAGWVVSEASPWSFDRQAGWGFRCHNGCDPTGQRINEPAQPAAKGQEPECAGPGVVGGKGVDRDCSADPWAACDGAWPGLHLCLASVSPP